MQTDERMIRRLWGFVFERQEVRYRRHHLHNKPPWTDDPVLRDNHFTNIYREDDPGTRYVVDEMLRARRPLSIAMWNVLWYRMWGKEATWERWRQVAPHQPFEPTPFSISVMERVMRSMADGDGEGPFTGAYMVSNYGRAEDKVTVMVDVMRGAEEVWHSRVQTELGRAVERGGDEGRRMAHAAFAGIHGVGPFVAFQTLVDLCYPVLGDLGLSGASRLPFDNDGWATCGPGAERGLKHCIPGITKAQWNDGLAMLVDRSHGALAVRGFWWRTGGDGNDQPLDRANMCNCLCEFDKYVRLSAGGAKGRRRSFRAVESYKRDREARGHGHQFDIEEALP